MQTFTAESTGGEPKAVPGRGIPLTETIELPGVVMDFARNEEIFGEEEPAEFVCKVVSGAARTVRILSDGRRQVGAFLLPGEVFGFEHGQTHRFSAEAVSGCRIALVRRSAVEKTAEQSSRAARELWALATGELSRLQDHVLLLGRKNASERVAAFLLDMAFRTAGDGDAVELPMSRTDIADYLGLTIETVSRTLAQMERDRAIALPSCRRVLLLNRAALAPLDG